MQLSHLFSPVTINGMTLKNRAVMPPMGTGYGNADSTVSDRLVSLSGPAGSGRYRSDHYRGMRGRSAWQGFPQRDRRLER